MKQSNLRMTRQRKVILEVLRNVYTHPNPGESVPAANTARLPRFNFRNSSAIKPQRLLYNSIDAVFNK
jgi:hypothetical protein